MRRVFLMIFSVVLLGSCSLIKNTANDPVVQIDQMALQTSIANTTKQIIEGNWLSDFMRINNERPTIIISRLLNNTNAVINPDSVYHNIDIALVQTGQVRVVQSTENQRLLNPIELVNALNIDYVLSVTIQKNSDTNTKADLEFSLWSKASQTPLITKKNTIE